MVGKRTLPERRNALLEPHHSPSHEILAERRRLGQTNLALKPGLVGLSNTTKPENLGTFDYAHLRVPLPKDLSGSGIFTLKTATSYPESYFLMRRSNDGYISATGMFKAAFPWATLAEEEAERRYQKTFPSAGPEEVAGSVWISPEEALHLAEEYGMRHWIVALLDPSPIEKGTKDRLNSHIQMPPLFDVNKATATPAVVLPPSSSLRPTRARSSRSASPSKIATPSRKIASPRKPRATRSAAKPDTSSDDVVETKAPVTFGEDGLTASDSVTESVVASESVITSESVAEAESVNDEEKRDTVRIEVQETVEQDGDVERTTTNVRIDVPADHPALPTPEDPTKLIEEAKRMVEEARVLDQGASTGSKRKAEDTEEDLVERPAKQPKTITAVEQQLKKELVTRRALVGLTFMAAIGTAFQYFT